MFEKVENQSYSESSYLLKEINRFYSFKVFFEPTGNCQLFSIANFCKIIHLCKTKADFKKAMRSIKEVCYLKKPFVLIDIRQYDRQQLSKKLHIAGEIPYDSPTGSKMVTLIIDLRK